MLGRNIVLVLLALSIGGAIITLHFGFYGIMALFILVAIFNALTAHVLHNDWLE